ncbi:Transposable element Tcb2 transposase [Araneus ventricosus]|uniref:Transposable element Tcb2 transposase n=1 Tax=Araneus ventricosus TaxID=182803 RepID=A0A4Y2AWT5_ARAVE|nr:Transposable element Tcb2 transposase [Araneus ventricosus]
MGVEMTWFVDASLPWHMSPEADSGNKFQYEDILENTMSPYARNSLGRGFIFQQDNDLKHRCKHIQNWFSRRHVTLLDWPIQSPDLNIIEGGMGRAGASS